MRPRNNYSLEGAMKVSIETKPFLKALKAVSLLTKKPEMDTLKNCLLSAKDNFLNIAAVYFEPNSKSDWSCKVFCNIKLHCDIDEEGTILVCCEDLYKFCNSQKKIKDIQICDSDKKDWSKYVDVIAGTSKATLKQGDLMEYPELEWSGCDIHNSGITVESCRFIKAINMVKGCLSKDYSRFELCNYFIDITDNDLCLFTTNGHAMSLDRLPIHKMTNFIKLEKNERGYTKYININSKSLDLVLQMFGDSEYLEIYKIDDILYITDYDSYVVVKCLYKALDYKQFTNMSLSNFHKFSVKRDSFARAIKNVSAATKKTNLIGLEFNADNLRVFTNQNFANYDLSDVAECEPEYNFCNITICFNYKYLLNAISELDDEFYVYVEDKESPALFYNQDSSRFLHVIMPIVP